jgi:hypothetical protein
MNGFSRRAVRQPLLEKREKWRTPAKLIVRAVWFPPLRKRRARMGHPRPVLEKRENWRTPAKLIVRAVWFPPLRKGRARMGHPRREGWAGGQRHADRSVRATHAKAPLFGILSGA